jgi:CheY-like chemotaxis protein
MVRFTRYSDANVLERDRVEPTGTASLFYSDPACRPITPNFPFAAYDNAPRLDTGTILVLDDDVLALDLVAQVASSALPGYRVATETCVAEAFAMCETRPIDCLIIDYDMPSVDGLTAARFLRARHPAMPIIMFTGVGNGSLAVEAMLAGVNGYIPKHRISSELLRRTVRSAMALARSGAHLGSADAGNSDLS